MDTDAFFWIQQLYLFIMGEEYAFVKQSEAFFAGKTQERGEVFPDKGGAGVNGGISLKKHRKNNG